MVDSTTLAYCGEAARSSGGPRHGTGDLGAGVKVLGHNALRAKARLVSPVEAERDLGAFAVPAILRDEPKASQPFLFESARGTDPGLGALELFEIENPDSVTADTPLTLRVDAQLQEGERILPYAWDGEFFLPLGAGRQAGNSIEIELRQLPAPRETARDIERGIFKSVRILFQKLAASYLGTKYDYPLLAVVNFQPGGEPLYDATTEAVRAVIAKASRILLYVHGILGDTLGMTASARAEIVLSGSPSHRIGDSYDVILAFDYENINTQHRGLPRAISSDGLRRSVWAQTTARRFMLLRIPWVVWSRAGSSSGRVVTG